MKYANTLCGQVGEICFNVQLYGTYSNHCA